VSDPATEMSLDAVIVAVTDDRTHVLTVHDAAAPDLPAIPSGTLGAIQSSSSSTRRRCAPTSTRCRY